MTPTVSIPRFLAAANTRQLVASWSSIHSLKPGCLAK